MTLLWRKWSGQLSLGFLMKCCWNSCSLWLISSSPFQLPSWLWHRQTLHPLNRPFSCSQCLNKNWPLNHPYGSNWRRQWTAKNSNFQCRTDTSTAALLQSTTSFDNWIVFFFFWIKSNETFEPWQLLMFKFALINDTWEIHSRANTVLKVKWNHI